jgi:uncharacterized protein YciI
LRGGYALVFADQVHACVDQRQVRERLPEVPEVARPVRATRRLSDVAAQTRYRAGMDFDSFTVVLLVTGESAPELTPEQASALQDAHLAYLAGLHADGPLLTAGPLRDEGRHYRGLSLFGIPQNEARSLAEADPAVRAGVFGVIVLPRLVPAGALSFSPVPFPRSTAEASGD